MRGSNEGRQRIFQPIRHIYITVQTPWGDKSCFFLILPSHTNLMEARICVEEGEQIATRGGVDDLVDTWKWVRVLGARLVEVGVVDAHAELTTSLRDDNGVCKPLRVLDFSDESGVEEFVYLEANEILPLDGLLAHLLLDGLRAGEDLQLVLNHIPGDPGHVGWLPCKDIDIIPEECDEREFLFLHQAPANAGGLGGVWPDLHSLGWHNIATGGPGNPLPGHC